MKSSLLKSSGLSSPSHGCELLGKVGVVPFTADTGDVTLPVSDPSGVEETPAMEVADAEDGEAGDVGTTVVGKWRCRD